MALLQGRGAARVIEQLYRGEIKKALPHAQWTNSQNESIRGVDRILICGTIGVSEPFGSIVRQATEKELADRLPKARFRQILVRERSGVAAAEGAFLLLKPARARAEVRRTRQSKTCAALLLDVGGTKTHVEVAELGCDGTLKRPGVPLLEQEFPTPKGPPMSRLYDCIARRVLNICEIAS